MAKPLLSRSTAGIPATNAASAAEPRTFTADPAALARGLKTHDPAANAVFFQRYAGRVESIVTRVLGFDAEMADVSQEVFASVLASLHTLKDASLLEHWLSRVAVLTARRVLRTRLRRRWLRSFVDASEEERYEPVAATLDVEGRRALLAVHAVLASLPADERTAFALRFIDGMELTEIAAKTGVSLSTAKRRVARAEASFVAGATNYPELVPWIQRRAARSPPSNVGLARRRN